MDVAAVHLRGHACCPRLLWHMPTRQTESWRALEAVEGPQRGVKLLHSAAAKGGFTWRLRPLFSDTKQHNVFLQSKREFASSVGFYTGNHFCLGQPDSAWVAWQCRSPWQRVRGGVVRVVTVVRAMVAAPGSIGKNEANKDNIAQTSCYRSWCSCR
jgi:hypothetical protein